MIHRAIASLGKVVAPGKGSQTLVLIFDGVDRISILVGKEIEEEFGFPLIILVAMIEDRRNSLRSSSTFRLPYHGIETDLILEVDKVGKCLISAL